MARPTALTDELIEEIADKIRRGHDPGVASQSSGVSRASFYGWMKAGKESDDETSLHYRFWTAVARAQADAEIELGDRVLQGDDAGKSFGQSKAALEFLSRRIPKRWAQRVNVKVEQELEELLDVVRGICSPEDFERVLEAIAARDSEEEA